MSGDVFNYSLKTSSAALEAAYQPSQSAVFALIFNDFFVDVCQDNLDSPNYCKEDRPKSDCSNMNPQSPPKSSANRAVELFSIRSEIPDACDGCKYKLTSAVDEGHMPKKGKQMVVPCVPSE